MVPTPRRADRDQPACVAPRSVQMSDPMAALTAELAEIGADAVRRSLVVATGGNLSARLPGSTVFVVTARATRLDRLGDADFSVLDLDGVVLAGNPDPSSEWRLHQRTYRIRPDVSAIVHLHPHTAVLVDALGYPVRLLTLDHAAYLRRVARIPFFRNGTDELADAAAEASRDCDAIILAHHGCSTLGDSIASAYRRALLLEDAALSTFRCLQLGDTSTAFPEEALDGLRHL
jgi:ribulose-5-phosphate 4-epimerase/fuculose-1-phosphate aldolase